MKIFFDTEFIEDGRTIDLVSIGLVREDGKELYMVSSEFDESKADAWVRENVLYHLEPGDRRLRRQIASAIHAFVGEQPEFWAYYADYDWVALCQLYGRMIDLPKGWPMYCRDVKQWADQTRIPLPKQTGIEHHALYDARWVRQAHNIIEVICHWNSNLTSVASPGRELNST